MTSYWERLLRQRTSRRRALAATSTTAAAAAFLAACGGDGDGGDSKKSGSGILDAPQDSSGRAKAGGTLKFYSVGDIDHFDATISATSQTVSLSSEPFYPRMLGLATAKYPKEPDGGSKGELAEKWELSPDHLQITFKLRQGMKWDNRAPTSGRLIDASDVLFSWNKFLKLNNASLSLAANIESVTSPDAQTILVKMKSPDSSIIPLFSGRDLLYVEPKEADGGFNPRNEVRGYGPWVLEEYVPSSRFVYARNPNYFLKDRPFPDKVEVPIVSDASQRLAQFKAGNIQADVLTASQQDIVQTKKDLPQTLLQQAGSFNASSTALSTFGWDPGSPWHDKRARQAVSMMIDRPTFADVIYNRDKFAAEGLDVPIRYNSIVPGGWGDYWLDPTNEKEFGPEAKYLKFDLVEAKKLMAAAGHPNGFEFELIYNGGPEFGAAYARSVEMYAGFFGNGGLKVKQRPITPFNKWVNEFSRLYTVAFGAYGTLPGHTGMTFIAERAYSTLPVQIRNQMHKDGQGYRGMVPPGGSVPNGDPKSNDLSIKIDQEFDRKKQIALVHELIRYATNEMYYLPRVAAEKAFSLWWPAIGNVGADVGYPNAGNWADVRINWWVDTSKPPLGKA
ncbi:MAG TPA: ABC transporter substrate-binding protein [Dehalococcoidia bacterium]|nr:ABC transporter substrate-binding protein [Dehalococcoidia bacterium]